MEIEKKTVAKMKAYAALIGIVVLVVSLVAVAGCQTATETSSPEPTASSSPSTEPIEIKWTTVTTSTHIDFLSMEQWAKEVEEKTDGKVKFTVYPSNTLCSPLETYNAVKTGLADMGTAPTGYSRQYLPLNKFVGDAMKGLETAEQNVTVYNKVFSKFPALEEEFKDVHYLWGYTSVPLSISTSGTAIRTLSDFEGITMRMPPGLEPLAEAWGASPVSMPISEIYVALEKGTMDGYFGGAEMLESMKLAELTDYVTIPKMVCATVWVGMNPDTWESLPGDVQQVINDMTQRGQNMIVDAVDKSAEENLQYAEEQGLEIINPGEAELQKIYDASSPVFNQIAADLEEKGYPADEILSELGKLGAQ
ncbi:MAG: TRAP transporter substrate-binding protein DctP [Dehalococcoidia bacterium]